MCFLCQSLDPKTEIYDLHGLTGDLAGTTSGSTGIVDLPVYTLDQVALQLTHGYWQSTNRDWRAFDVQAGDTLTVNLDGLDPTGQAAAMTALAAWTAASGLIFVVTSDTADITFDDTESGAYSYSWVYDSWNLIDSSFVNVHPSWQGYGEYYLQTYIHEIGHALGLGHGGNYNGSAGFADNAHYANDSWQMSIMSYFSQWENPYTDATGNYLATPMMADILAIQTLYGTPTNVNTGNTVYGDNTTLTQLGMDLNSDLAVTIFDSEGIDLIDLGSRGHDQRLTLLAESFSDLDGEIGNFAIARGAVIENAITGSGNDEVIGNAAANHIQTGAGNDTLEGGLADDTLEGGTGNDILSGGGGNDILYVATATTPSHGLDTASGGEGNDRIYGSNGANLLMGDAGNDTLTGGDDWYTADRDTLLGGDGDDLLQSGQVLVPMATTQGNGDLLDGGAGNDTLEGGLADDTLEGGAGNDILSGGGGNDILYVATATTPSHGLDTASGGEGNDRIYGSNGASLLMGDAGNDTLTGGDDWYTADRDTLLGGDGDDLLQSGQVLVPMATTQGNGDLLDGGAGNDTLEGGLADDTLEGGAGNDILSGGGGNDHFVFAPSAGVDRVTDYVDGWDRLDVSAFGSVSTWSAHQDGTDAEIWVNTQLVVVLENTNAAEIGIEDFLF